MKKKIKNGVLISLLYLAFCILSGATGWPAQMLVVSVSSALAVYFSYRYVGSGIASLAVIAPFYLLYTPLSIKEHSYQTFPIWIGGLLISFVTYFLLHFKTRPRFAIPVISFLIWFGVMIIWPNNFSYLNIIRDHREFDISTASLTDQNGKIISPEALKGKVVMFDIWHSACYTCIKQFPELEELSDYYKNDTTVKIICLNVPLARDKGVKPTRFTDKFDFLKFYFQDEDAYHRFSGEEDVVPYKIIFDKAAKCRFVTNGELKNTWNIFIGNEKRIINKLKNEKT